MGMMFMVYRGFAIILICLLAACGQKGDLYMPTEPAPTVSPDMADPAETVDANPAEQGDEETDEE